MVRFQEHSGFGGPESRASQKLSEDEKKALELSGRAEHETGRKREILEEEVRRKAEGR